MAGVIRCGTDTTKQSVQQQKKRDRTKENYKFDTCTMADANTPEPPQSTSSIKEKLRGLSLVPSSPPRPPAEPATTDLQVATEDDASNLQLVQQLFQVRSDTSNLATTKQAPSTVYPPLPSQNGNAPPNPAQPVAQQQLGLQDTRHGENDDDDDYNPLKRKSEDEADCDSESDEYDDSSDEDDDDSDLDDDELAMIQTLLKGIEEVKEANRNMKLRLLAHHRQHKKARLDQKPAAAPK